MADLLIKNAEIYDGTGADPVQGNLAVEDGKVVALGADTPSGSQEIDADGLAVMPGFVDLRTHFDAQVTWDPLGSCACWHGVTSVMMGNCGCALAPCKPEEREWFAQCLRKGPFS